MIIVDINDNGKYEGLMGLDTEKKRFCIEQINEHTGKNDHLKLAAPRTINDQYNLRQGIVSKKYQNMINEKQV